MLLSGHVYKYKCGGCNATYYSKTKCHFKVRICEPLVIHISLEKSEDWQQQANEDPKKFLCCNYSPSFEDFFYFDQGK